ncbi:MAG: hypothetical protein JXR96_15955, partial [Deltaproteobacteria bacterium]|nr:hypothetical protein [Deltaproteobacteria bacterium]
DCDSGYHREGADCVPDGTDPCDPDPCAGAHELCTPDGQGGYTCDCDSGYHRESEACLPDCDASTALCAAAHTSAGHLVSANGHGAVIYERAGRKLSGLLEHVYRNWDDGIHTRDLLYDSYLGVRSDSGRAWLNDPAVSLVREEYLEQTGIVHLVQRFDGFRIETFAYAPWQLGRPAIALLGRVTNEGTSTRAVSLYSLHNHHLGFTSAGDPVNPDAQGEEIAFRAGSAAYLETGVGGMILHLPIGPTSHHGCSPNNPWVALNEGRDLGDESGSGLGDDRVAGFQRDFSLGPGESGWLGVVSAFEPDSGYDAASLESELTAVYGGLDAGAALQSALDEWEAWRSAPPAGLSTAELAVWRQSEAVLRQGQVWEGGLSEGQIVASMPPGNWNICWMRDMAYAISALVRSGHLAEARAALGFVLRADSGTYASYVGLPYQVTVTRYFGRGKEESDTNADGPNIEFDGFGTFLWVLGEYVAASSDQSLLDDHWTAIQDLIAGALVGLEDPATGMIQADSSIWEVHWDPRKRFSYTSLAAARGLCQAAELASLRGLSVLESAYRAQGCSVRDGVQTHCTDGDGALASSVEEIQSGSGFRDMAVVEALDWLLFDPAGDAATATLDVLEASQRVASGRGFFRNDDGGWYDQQEWVFVDLRASVAMRLAGRTQTADDLLGWITAQALENYGMIAELQHPDTSDYEGEVPMVGFGAGAYILAVLERVQPRTVAPICGTWESP